MSNAHDDNIFFFYVEAKIPTSHVSMTGAEIKALIHEKGPSFDVSHELVLEGHGSEEDKLIKDGDAVSLAHGHGEGPKHFYSRPPTNFGA
jgi:hypothetical protein